MQPRSRRGPRAGKGSEEEGHSISELISAHVLPAIEIVGNRRRLNIKIEDTIADNERPVRAGQ
jgi:2-keto-4-pentenoate hydratase